jgi:hypothetical protein
VAGPVEHGVIVDAARCLEALPRGLVADPIIAPPTAGRAALAPRQGLAGSQTNLAILFRGVPEIDPGYPAFVALLRALDDGMSTRLHYQLADQQGLAYSIGAAIEPLADTALFEVTSATANAKLPTLVGEILGLVGGLRDEAIGADELAKIRTRYRYETVASLDDSGGDGRLVRRHRAVLPAAGAGRSARRRSTRHRRRSDRHRAPGVHAGRPGAGRGRRAVEGPGRRAARGHHRLAPRRRPPPGRSPASVRPVSHSPAATGAHTIAVPTDGTTDATSVSSPSTSGSGTSSTTYAIVATAAWATPAPPTPMNRPRPVSVNAAAKRG